MTIARPCQLLAVGTAVCLGGALFAGNLISSVRDTRLDRLDPTYPHCF
jgi:hypothetical protein